MNAGTWTATFLCLFGPMGAEARTAQALPARQQPVESATVEPFASVCHLYVTRAKPLVRATENNSTAFLLQGGRYLLTAAHNVYSPWFNRVRSIAVHCGVTDAGTTPQQIVGAENTRVATGYGWTLTRRTDFPHDFAIVRLDAPIAAAAGFALADLATVPDGSTVHLAGFPGVPDERDGMSGQRLFAGTGAMTRAGKFVAYRVETETGNSGGPAWIDSPRGPQAVAIHVRGSEGKALDAETQAEIKRMIASLERPGRGE